MIDLDLCYDQKKRSIIMYILKQSSKYTDYHFNKPSDRVLFIMLVNKFVKIKPFYITETIMVNRVYDYNLKDFPNIYKQKATIVYDKIKGDVFKYIKTLTII